MKEMGQQLDVFEEIIVDNFAGGGGASTGIELACGRPVTIAINHDPDAILMHRTNHPYTQHFQASVWDIDPKEVCLGRPVGLAWFSPDCFPAGTLILTNRGYIPIENVKVGDLVLTHKMRWRRVTDTMTTQRDEMVVKGYGHPGMVCSTGHPFYVRERSELWNEPKNGYEHIYSAPIWKKAKDLTSKDYWGCPMVAEPLQIPSMEKPNAKTLTLPIDERLLWLAGRYTGDGWSRITDTRGEVVIVCGPDEVDFLRGKLNMWPKKGKRARDGELSWRFRKVRTGGQFTCDSRSLVLWLRNNFGHLASEKQIPAWLITAPDSFKKAFLDGYVGADGYLNGNLIETSTVSKKLAFGLKTLVTTLGYSPCVYRQEGNTGIIEGRKVRASSIFKVRWRPAVDEKHQQTFADNSILWAPIKSAEETGRRGEFFNISVEEDESYVAEGIIVHNCKHFSKAKGGKPVDKNIRGLAWIVLRWAGTVRPRVIILENVEEFQTWGPVRKGKPVKAKAGQTFRQFISQLRNLDYTVEWKELVAADYGAPTIRKRFFLVARCDGKPIVWPEPTHAPADSPDVAAGRKKPWRGAAEIIDWTMPCPSIFDSKEEIKKKYGLSAQRPLRPNTMRRVARGIDKFVLKEPKPYIAILNHGGFRGQESGEPLNTVTGKHGYGVVTPTLIQYHSEQSDFVRGQGVNRPILTVDAANRYGLVAPVLSKYYGTATGQEAGSPLHTVTAKDRMSLVTANLTKFYGGVIGAGLEQPTPTVTAVDHNGLQMTHLVKFKGPDIGHHPDTPLHTITAGGGTFGLVQTTIQMVSQEDDIGRWPQVRKMLNTYCDYDMKDDEILLLWVDGVAYFIFDVGLRMLTPRELYAANGFPPDYIIDRDFEGNSYGKAKQVARCGNAVPPPFATALVRANLPEWCKGVEIDTMQKLEEAVAV